MGERERARRDVEGSAPPGRQQGKERARNANTEGVVENNDMLLGKKVAGRREEKENVGTIEKWCKGGDEKTEEVLREGAEAEREREMDMYEGRRVHRSSLKGKERDREGELIKKMEEKWKEKMNRRRE